MGDVPHRNQLQLSLRWCERGKLFVGAVRMVGFHSGVEAKHALGVRHHARLEASELGPLPISKKRFQSPSQRVVPLGGFFFRAKKLPYGLEHRAWSLSAAAEFRILTCELTITPTPDGLVDQVTDDSRRVKEELNGAT